MRRDPSRRGTAIVFAGRYYFELQVTDQIEQNELNSQLMALSGELDIPLVATNDCHYLKEKDVYAHYILELMGLQKRVSDLDKPSMKSNQLYLKSPEEMQTAFSSYPQEVLTNSVLIAEQCKLSLENNSYFFPKFGNSDGRYTGFLFDPSSPSRTAKTFGKSIRTVQSC